MITLQFIRVLFVLLSTVVGFQLGGAIHLPGAVPEFIGAGIGAVIACFIIFLEHALGHVSLRGLTAAVFGLTLALIVSKFISGAIDLVPELDAGVGSTIKLVMVLVLSYLGMIFSLRGRDEFNLIIPYVKFERQDQSETPFILDTSAIIDGRILDLCETKFVEGRFLVPRFVLKELQQIADSSDALKRTRGRRGLDVLNKLRKGQPLNFRVQEEDFPDLESVDEKLVKLGKVLGAKVVTNDYNLNKVAEFQGVAILNINDLANAMRPVLLPGESLEIRLVKEGKEHHQAVGYLDDGTMVVVENGRRFLGSVQRVEVSSVLQTSAGRMVFARPKEPGAAS